MGTEKSNAFGTPYKLFVPQDGTLNKPLAPHWAPSMKAYHNSGSTPTPFSNPHAAGSYFCNYMWPNQANGTTLQYDFLHDPRSLSNSPIVAGDAALIFSEKVRRIFGENNLESTKKCDGNLQPESLKVMESRKNGNRSSIPKNERDGVSLSAASGSNESPGEGHDTNNDALNLWQEDYIKSFRLQDFPSNKKQQCNMMLGNANSTEPNQNLGTSFNASGSNAQFSKLEEDEIRKERKRQSNRESAKRSRIRKQQECEELHRNMDILKDENSKLTHRLMRLSEDCLEVSNENDSIQEELVKMYGPESIADLMAMKPASGGSQTVKEESYN